MQSPVNVVYFHSWHAMFWSSMVFCVLTAQNIVVNEPISHEVLFVVSSSMIMVLVIGIGFRSIARSQPHENFPAPVIRSGVFLFASWWFYFQAGFTIIAPIFSIMVGAMTAILYGGAWSELNQFVKPVDLELPVFAVFALLIANFFYKRALNPPFWHFGTALHFFSKTD